MVTPPYPLRPNFGVAQLTQHKFENRPPTSGDCLLQASSTSSGTTAVAVNTAMLNVKTVWQSDGADAYILFGLAGVNVDPTQTSGAKVGFRMVANTPYEFYLNSNEHTYFAVQAQSGTPNIRYYKASQQHTGQG